MSLVRSLSIFMNFGGKTDDWPSHDCSLSQKLPIDIKIAYRTWKLLYQTTCCKWFRGWGKFQASGTSVRSRFNQRENCKVVMWRHRLLVALGSLVEWFTQPGPTWPMFGLYQGLSFGQLCRVQALTLSLTLSRVYCRCRTPWLASFTMICSCARVPC